MIQIKEDNVVNQRESLDSMLTSLIAEADNISPEEVTERYIIQKRKEFYEDARYNIGSSYGGHSLIGLASISRKDLKEISRRIKKIAQKKIS